MPRVARIVLPGFAHHVTHRGNRGGAVFLRNSDREDYLRRLLHYSEIYGLRIRAHCLMTNHIHVLGVPDSRTSLDRAIGRAHMAHAKALNRREGWTGHLWGNRFYSAPVEPAAVAIVARYIELNPVRAGLCDHSLDYPWSSARGHCGKARDPVLPAADPLAEDPERWLRWLERGISREEARWVWCATSTGTPIGSAEFLARLEGELGIRLIRRPYRRSAG